MQAIWNGHIIANSDKTIVVESNHYFQRSSLVSAFFIPSESRSMCHWKGEAHYFTLLVDGQENKDAAWYYPAPLASAKKISGCVAFWKGVEVKP